MRLTISHLTKYEYDKPVHYALQQVRLTPKSQASQNVLTWNVTVEGGRKQLEFTDQHNNLVNLVSLHEDQSEISIHCQGEVETIEPGGMAGRQYGYTPLWYFKRPSALTRPGEQIHDFVASLVDDPRDDLTRLHALSRSCCECRFLQEGADKLPNHRGKTRYGRGTACARTIRTCFSVRHGSLASRLDTSAGIS